MLRNERRYRNDGLLYDRIRAAQNRRYLQASGGRNIPFKPAPGDTQIRRQDAIRVQLLQNRIGRHDFLHRSDGSLQLPSRVLFL